MIAQPSQQPDVAEPLRPNAKNSAERIKGLDSIRFILAFWVVLSHFGNFPLRAIYPKPFEKQAILGVWNTTFIGVAAVVVFFLISGFCIHLPYFRGRSLRLQSYFVRREVRIVLPVIAAFAIAALIRDYRFTGVLWSLVCEEIYYFLYPVMLKIRNRDGSWKRIMYVAVAGAVAVIAFYMNLNRHLPMADRRYDFQVPGFAFTWLVGLPMWLAGCILAEKTPDLPAWNKPKVVIWAWRLGMWAVSIFIGLIRFHGPGRTGNISYMVTLPLFAIGVFYWLYAELSYAKTYPPSKWVEALGLASFTLYLTHMLGAAMVGVSEARIESPVVWFEALAAVAILCLAFYYLIEKPSHKLAKMVGDKLDGASKR